LVNITAVKLRSNEVIFTAEELRMTIDLGPYVNMATFVVRDDFPLQLAYRIYRNMGLRHLFVVDEHNEIQGVITRNELLEHHLEELEKHEHAAGDVHQKLENVGVDKKNDAVGATPLVDHSQKHEAEKLDSDETSGINAVPPVVPLEIIEVHKDELK